MRITAQRKRFLERSQALRSWEFRLRKGWCTEEEYEKAVERLFSVRMRELGLDPDGDPPLFQIPESLGDPESDILVGYPVHDETLMPGLYLPVEEFGNRHVGLWGKSRWGKTFQMCHLLSELSRKEADRTFLAYDTQGELHRILENLIPEERLFYIPVRDYWKNLLQDVTEREIEQTLGAFRRALMESQFIGVQTVNILQKKIRWRCSRERVNALGLPSLSEILHSIRRLEEEQSTGRGAWKKGIDYLHSLINILENLSLNLGEVYNRKISRGFSLRDFESKVVVIDISTIRDPVSLKFFVTKELLDIFMYAERPHPPLTVLLDEIHRFAPLEKQFGAFTTPILVDGVKTLLKYRVNFWMAEQNPGQFVHPAILANVGTHFIFRLPSVKDRWPACYAANITDREQADMIGALEHRHCIVYTDSLRAGVLIKTPDVEPAGSGERTMERSSWFIRAFHERFLSSDAAQRVTRKQQESRPVPVQDFTRKRIAEHRARYPFSGITETYEYAGVSPEAGRKHVNDMVDMGWLEGPVSMPAHGSGNKTVNCYVLTQEGCKSLGMDWERVRLPGKGSVRSRLAARVIGDRLEKQGRVVRYEYKLSSGEISKAADVAVLEENGSVTAYEYQDTTVHVVENILRNFEAGFRRTVVVCANKKSLEKARKAAMNGIDPELFSETRFMTLREFS